MKIFLASEAKHPESMLKLKSFVGGFEGKSIAYVPTALNGEELYGDWERNSSSWKLVQTLGANVTSVVLEEYKDVSVVDVLREKDIIWFAGGACGYLMYWLRRCELDHFLPELLASGAVYVGSSAGSMVTAHSLGIAEWYLDEEEKGVGVIPGLGLVDFEIYPHYEESMYESIKEKRQNENQFRGKTPLYLLKNGEAITVENNVITVLGEKRIL